MTLIIKKTVSLITVLSLLLSLSVAFSPLVNGAEHVHDGTLTEICLNNQKGIDFCGKFHCRVCGNDYYAPVTSADIGIPLINIEGDMSGVTKDDEQPVRITYSSSDVNFVSDAKIKWQGSTSLGYPKKNYNIKLYREDGSKNKIQIVPEWGKQFKYCLKANYIDPSHARNIVSARIFNEIVHQRGKDDGIGSLDNGGVIDGFPVALYENGVFYGLYTFNIPKDKWAWGMSDETKKQGLMFAAAWGNNTEFLEPITDFETSGWEIEYCSTEDDPEVGCQWLVDSMNELIAFASETSDKITFRENIGKYLDVDRTIDVILYTYFIHADDNTAKNIVWATYDGTVWIPCMYDMDATWGLFWDGNINRSDSDFLPHYHNLLFRRIIDFFRDDVAARYKELRSEILSKRYIEYYFASFINSIPQVIKTADHEKWKELPDYDKNNLDQIVSFAQGRIKAFDENYNIKGVVEKTEISNKCFFRTDKNTRVFVFDNTKFEGTPTESAYAFSISETGTLSRYKPQICFRIETADGYRVSSIKIEGGSGGEVIETPEETGVEGCYRIKNIGNFENFIITTEKTEEEEPQGYTVDFVCGNGGAVRIFEGSDYTKESKEASSALSLDSDTLEPTQSGDGQVNFEIVADEGYIIKEVTAEPKNYKNFKLPEDTGRENTYRLTKITGDITVKVTFIKLTAGDIDLNGRISAIDVFMLKSVVANKYTPEIRSVCDMNGDRRISALDAYYLVVLLANKQ